MNHFEKKAFTEQQRNSDGNYKLWLSQILLCLLLICHIDVSIAADDTQAVAEVERFHTLLLDVMQNADSLGYEGRFKKLAPVITKLFDTPLISKVILSRYWKEFNEQDKNKFIELFNHLTIATYASRFDGYSGESFKYITTEQLKKGRVLIKTELHAPGETPVRLDYLMHPQADQWLIISVIADGVNDLSLKRAEYASVIKDQGFDALLEQIHEKILNLEKP